MSNIERLVTLRTLTRSGEARAIRERSCLAVADVARAVKVDPSTVSRWELGQRLPRGRAAVAYASLLERLAKRQDAA